MSKKKLLLITIISVLLGTVMSLAQETFSWEQYEKYGADKLTGKVNVANSPYFLSPDIYNLVSNSHITVISKFKTRQQQTNFSCGPCVAAMVVNYYTGKDLHTEKEIAEIMGTSITKGTDLPGMKRYFDHLKWKTSSSLSSSSPKKYREFLNFVKKNLESKIPIMVENIDWGGHWRIIIGYDDMGTDSIKDDVLFMADPFDTSDHLQDGYNIISAERFFCMWFDAHLYKEGQRDKLWLTAVPQ